MEDADFEAQKKAESQLVTPYPFSTASELMKLCQDNGIRISSLMLKNETIMCSQSEVYSKLVNIWGTMQECLKNGKKLRVFYPENLKSIGAHPVFCHSLKMKEATIL
ncbi:MAG: L-serine dehydratase [Paraglaciecola sp.]